MIVEITDEAEMKYFVGTHMAHRLTSLLSPICRKQDDCVAWGNRNDTYRAAKEGSYVMLRLLIEFLGIVGDRKHLGKLRKADRQDDDLRLDSFRAKWGTMNLDPGDFGIDEPLVADTHRTLCKINAHFTYDDRQPHFYDRIASLSDNDWIRATELVLQKLHVGLYQKVKEPIVVHEDLVDSFRKTFPAFSVQGGKLERT